MKLVGPMWGARVLREQPKTAVRAGGAQAQRAVGIQGGGRVSCGWVWGDVKGGYEVVVTKLGLE